MKKYFICIFIVLLVIVFNSCSSSKPITRQYSEIKYYNKTITLPAGGDQLLGLLKEKLFENGWNISILLKESTVTEKTENIEISYDKYKTAYILILDYSLFSNWKLNDSVLKFDFSLIDTKTKQEVLTYSGQGKILRPFKYEEVVDGFIEEINGRMK
jgi:hypothetical protein